MNLIDFIAKLIEIVIALVVLAAFASFSPTLYMAQISSRQQRSQTVKALFIGVAAAISLLLIIFQFVQVDTLLTFFGNTQHVLFINGTTLIVLGVLSLYGGLRLFRPMPKAETKNLPSKVNTSKLAGFAFIKVITKISGLTATFIAATLIAEFSINYPTRISMSLLFIAASLLPFLAIAYLLVKYPAVPEKIVKSIGKVQKSIAIRKITSYCLFVIGVIFLIWAVFNIVALI